MNQKIIKPIILTIVSLFILQSCNDSSEEIDPCKNGPTLLVNSVVATLVGQSSGMITVTASAGQSPYVYSLDGTNFQNSGTFSGLGAGGYTITLKDENNCTDTEKTTIKEVQEIFYTNQIRPIIDANCQIS